MGFAGLHGTDPQSRHRARHTPRCFPWHSRHVAGTPYLPLAQDRSFSRGSASLVDPTPGPYTTSAAALANVLRTPSSARRSGNGPSFCKKLWIPGITE